MQQNKIQALEQQILQLKNRLAQELARESDAERKRRSRQAIILGTWLMKNQPKHALAIANKALRRDQDRAAFGLPPWQDENSVPLAAGTVDILLPLDASPPSKTQPSGT